ncbi:hypothetical protein [Pyxidicoccus caerfyrddinensis]|uniref:hypothetical protein n=1 Tax=Pyxidicoccus caerfyrddinensis TaxID=2709663 RepID=UPI0013DD43B9|nr:hypothetical protein [Pyxidicoccus caerfyrddinensis]
MSQPHEEAPSPREASPRDPRRSVWRDARAALSLVFSSSLGFFILTALAFLAADLFLLGPNLQHLAFLGSRQPGVWHIFLSIQPALWVAYCFILWGEFKNRPVWPGTRRERMAVLFCTSVALVILSLPIVAQVLSWRGSPAMKVLSTPPIAAFNARVHILTLFGMAVLALHALGVFCVHVQLLRLSPASPSQEREPEAGDLDDAVPRYLRLRAQLRLLLGLAALNIGTSMLSIGISRNLLNEAFPSRPELFPAAPVVGFGIYYTGLIASVYVPIRKTLRNVGEALAERLVRQSLGPHAPWKAWSEELQAARAYLGMQESAFQELQQGLAVLAPLLGGLSSLLLSPGG